MSEGWELQDSIERANRVITAYIEGRGTEAWMREEIRRELVHVEKHSNPRLPAGGRSSDVPRAGVRTAAWDAGKRS